MTVSAGFSRTTRSTMAARLLVSTAAQRAMAAMPPLPGAATISVTSGEFLSAQMRACSRPPPPMTRTFIASLLEEKCFGYFGDKIFIFSCLRTGCVCKIMEIKDLLLEYRFYAGYVLMGPGVLCFS